MTSKNKSPTGLGKSYKVVPRPTIINNTNLTFWKTAKLTDHNSTTGDNAGKSQSPHCANGGRSWSTKLTIHCVSVSKDCKLVESKPYRPTYFKYYGQRKMKLPGSLTRGSHLANTNFHGVCGSQRCIFFRTYPPRSSKITTIRVGRAAIPVNLLT